MKRTQLGEFEEMVLLTVALLPGEAYSVAILEEMERRMERPMSIGNVHRTLQRLEEKGLVNSRFGEASAQRGGRRKRLFALSPAGEKALIEVRDLRNAYWAAIPNNAFQTFPS